MNSVEAIYVAAFGDFEFNPDLIERLLFYMNSFMNDDQARIVLMGDTVKPHDCDVKSTGTGHLTYTYEIAEKDQKFNYKFSNPLQSANFTDAERLEFSRKYSGSLTIQTLFQIINMVTKYSADHPGQNVTRYPIIDDILKTKEDVMNLPALLASDKYQLHHVAACYKDYKDAITRLDNKHPNNQGQFIQGVNDFSQPDHYLNDRTKEASQLPKLTFIYGNHEIRYLDILLHASNIEIIDDDSVEFQERRVKFTSIVQYNDWQTHAISQYVLDNYVMYVKEINVLVKFLMLCDHYAIFMNSTMRFQFINQLIKTEVFMIGYLEHHVR